MTSYSENDGKVVKIVGNVPGKSVVFNFAAGVNLGGDVTLSGLTDDQVLWNFTDSGGHVQLNNNASSFPLPDAFMRIILAPNDTMSMVNANLDGRFFGGDSSDMQIVSGDHLNAPLPSTPTPEPGTLTLFGTGLIALALGGFARRHMAKGV